MVVIFDTIHKLVIASFAIAYFVDIRKIIKPIIKNMIKYGN
jgi:hypothetical protein